VNSRKKSEEDEDEDEVLPAGPAGPMTLNKYLAHAGLSSRRDAATAIKEGKVQVNGETLLTPGYRVLPGDKVTYEGLYHYYRR
jgi:23S rRNA pseudouridine2605 synthase